MIPKYPFSLTLFGRDGRSHHHNFEALADAQEAISKYSNSYAYTRYELAVVVDQGTLNINHQHKRETR